MNERTTVCRVCDVEIPQDALPPSIKGRTKYICKPCLCEQQKKKYSNDPEKRGYHKRYYRENAERQKENVRRNKAKNPEKAREYRQRPETRIRKAQAKRIRAALSVNGTAKTYATLELIGCNALELKRHLEDQFQEGMSWDNYGNPNGDHTDCWHIDHIKPLHGFDLTDSEQQKKCFHFSNLQPLWAKDNLEKGASKYD
mgnify:CR=1 FL=1|jgi:hypothetical protein